MKDLLKIEYHYEDGEDLTLRRLPSGRINPLYKRWSSMKERCFRPGYGGYHRYGGRGITVCDSWRSSFNSFAAWALYNGFEPSLQLDRICNDGNYSPENCRFITPLENSRNRDLTPAWLENVIRNGIKPARAVLCVTSGEVYPSITKAAFCMDLHQANISKVCQGVRKHTGGFVFAYI